MAYNFNGLAAAKMDPDVVEIIYALFDHLEPQPWAASIWPGSGWRTGSAEHSSGRAVDVMISPKVNQAPTPAQRAAAERLVAELIAKGPKIGLQWLLWSKDDGSTWSYNFDRGSWKKLGSRGSVSADHRDHVHLFFKAGAKLPSGFRFGSILVSTTPAPALPSTGASGWDGKSFPGRTAFVSGRKHAAVKVAQQRLVAHGHNPGPIDSYWGAKSEAATRAFQRALGWSGDDADGVPGPVTWQRLLAAPKPKPAPPKTTRYRVTTAKHPLRGRKGPGTQHPVTMTAASGTILDIVETRNGWAKSKGGHWYSMQYLRKA